MTTIRIFLASSSELEGDRLQIEKLLGRKNRILKKNKLEFELVQWEYFIDVMSKSRLQDEYNEALKQCDLFVLLAFTKMGKFSKEEFKVAYETFLKKGRPRILIYFKNQAVKIHEITAEEINSLFDFKKAVNELGHFPNYYDGVEELKNHLYDQLEKLYIYEQNKHKTRHNQKDASRELQEIEERLNKYYKPILHRLKKDDSLWKLSSKLSNSSEALPLEESETFEEKYILPNHKEIIEILSNFAHLKLDDPRLDEEINNYTKHVAIFETIRSTESMKHLNPIDLNAPYPKYFKDIIESHIERLDSKLSKIKSSD